MPAQSKIDMLEKVSASLEASAGLFVIDYRGLTVKETQSFVAVCARPART